MTIAEVHAGPITSEDVQAVVSAARNLERPFDYLIGGNVALSRIGTRAIETEAGETFVMLRREASELGHISCGMIAHALNRIVRDYHDQQVADTAAAFARSLAAKRRAAGRCIRCGRTLLVPSVDGLGPECRRIDRHASHAIAI
jgi:hypothetical protein